MTETEKRKKTTIETKTRTLSTIKKKIKENHLITSSNKTKNS